MANYNYKTITGPFVGLDLRPNDLERDDNAASDMLNAHVTTDNLLSQRPGTIIGNAALLPISPFGNHIPFARPNSGFIGLINSTPGVSDPTFVPALMAISSSNEFDAGPSKLDEPAAIIYSTPATLTIGNGGAGDCSLQAVSSNFHLYSYDPTTGAQTSDLNIFNNTNPTPYSLAQFAIDGSIDPDVNITGDSAALSATSLVALGPFDTRLTRNVVAQFSRSFQIWKQTPVPGATNTTLINFSLNATGFDRQSDSVSFNGTTTYLTYSGVLFEIDGVRAFTPTPPVTNPLVTVTVTDANPGNVDIGVHNYAYNFRYYDLNGGFVDGPLITNNTDGDQSNPSPASPFTVTVNSTTKIVDVEINLTQLELSRYNTNNAPRIGATTSGSSPTPTSQITGCTGINLQAGDPIIVPLYNGGTGQISSVFNTTVANVIPGSGLIDTVDTLPSYDAGFLARNFTICLWRTAVSGTEYELVGESTVDCTADTHLLDNVADANLGEAYIPLAYVPGSPAVTGDLPPFEFLTIHDNLLVAASGSTVFWTLPDNLFTWSSDQNSFTVTLLPGDKISGIRSYGGTLFIWTMETLWGVTGALPQPGSGTTSFSLFQISASVGCINHKSITPIEGMIVWMGRQGLYSITPGGLPTVIDTPIRPLYSGLNKLNVSPLVDTGRACYDPNRRLFFCSATVQNASLSLQPFTLVWNIANGGSWELWSGLDSTAGSAYLPGYGPYFIDSVAHLQRFSDQEANMPDSFTAADGVNPIPFSYSGSWESMGSPSIAKNYTRFRLLAGQSGGTEQHFTLGVNLQKDYSLGSAGSKTMNFNLTTGFGLGAYGMTPYGDPTYSGLNMKPLNSKARSMRPVFTNNKLYEKVKIMGWEYELSPDFKQNKGSK